MRMISRLPAIFFTFLFAAPRCLTLLGSDRSRQTQRDRAGRFRVESSCS